MAFDFQFIWKFFDFCNVCHTFVYPLFYSYIVLSYIQMTGVTIICCVVGFMINVFIIYTIISLKYHLIRQIVSSILRNDGFPLSDEEIEKIEASLKTDIKLADMTEYAFGRFGRWLSHISLFLSFFLVGMMQMCNIGTIIARMYLMQTNHTDNRTINITSKNNNLFSYTLTSEGAEVLAVYTVGALILMVALSFPKNIRSHGFLNFIGVVSLLTAVIHIMYFLVTHTNSKDIDDDSVFDIRTMKQIFSGSSILPQIGATTLLLENSMVNNHKNFRVYLIATVLLGSILIIPIQIDLLLDPNDIVYLKRFGVIFMQTTTVVISLIGGIIYGIFITYLCIVVVEQGVSKICRRRCDEIDSGEINEVSMLLYFGSQRRNRSSTFERLRDNSNTDLTQTDLFTDLEMKVSLWIRIIIRLVVPIFMLSCAWIIYANYQTICIFTSIGTLTTSFIGYIIPVAQFLRVRWFHLTPLMQCMGVLLIGMATVISVLAETLYIYIVIS